MNRKQSAIIRIVAWSISAVLLAVILILGIRGDFRNVGFGSFSFGFNSSVQYSDADKYRPGNVEINGDEIESLEVNWVDGTITVEVYDGDTVQVSEKARKELEESKQLHYYNKNGRLMIQYRKAEKSWFSFGDNLRKELTIRIPVKTAEAMGEIQIDTVSSDTEIRGISAEQMKLDSTSGDFMLTKCHMSELDMDSTSGSLKGEALTVKGKMDTDTTSGTIDVKGSFGSVEADTVSGDITVDSGICPEKVRTDGVSGEVTLILPDNRGFTYESDTVSGSVECEFQITYKDDKGIYKDGDASFSFDSVSGDIIIKKRS